MIEEEVKQEEQKQIEEQNEPEDDDLIGPLPEDDPEDHKPLGNYRAYM